MGGTVYYVKLADGSEVALKHYRVKSHFEPDFQALKALGELQSRGTVPPFKIPRVRKRADLGTHVMELEYVQGTTVYDALKTLPGAQAERIKNEYNAKVAELKAFLEAHFQSDLSLGYGERKYLTGTFIAPGPPPTEVRVQVKPSNVLIEIPSGEMVLIDPY
jgi:hypothetical protein